MSGEYKEPNLINVILLCTVNVFFMSAGAVINSAVIISFWRSSSLRKKLCYYFILVLSCCDMAVVTVSHPEIVLSTLSYYLPPSAVWRTLHLVSYALYTFSLNALLTMNIERFLALFLPFFHQKAIDRPRLFILFCLLQAITLISLYSGETSLSRHVAFSVIIGFYFLLFAFMNFMMFTIAWKITDNKVIPFGDSAEDDTSAQEKRERFFKRIKKLKKFSTCSLAVLFYFIFCFPFIVYEAWEIAGDEPELLGSWAYTLFAMSSTFNCLIFFWRNTILRREGMKVMKLYLCEGHF